MPGQYYLKILFNFRQLVHLYNEWHSFFENYSIYYLE
jgi:hypothetical protein